jgi:hypothetical protein
MMGGGGGGGGGDGWNRCVAAQPLAEVNVGGGVWRLKWGLPRQALSDDDNNNNNNDDDDDDDSNGGGGGGGGSGSGGLHLLAASMHSGVHILRVSGGASSLLEVPNGSPVPPRTNSPLLSPQSPSPPPPLPLSPLLQKRPLAVEVVARYGGHGSMAYGADWLPTPPALAMRAKKAGGALVAVASCSFYDHAAHFWSGAI